MKKILALLIVLTVLVSLFSVIARADFGDFAGDADYGGDYGGDWGGGWDDDDDYSGGWYTTSTGGSSDDLSFFDIIVGLGVVAFIIFLVVVMPRKKKKKKPTVQGGATPTKSDALTPMSQYTSLDPAFSEQKFREKVANLYVQMQNCWTDRDIEPLRPYFTDALFTQSEMQINQIKKLGRINYVERIAVLDVKLLGFKQENGEDVICAQLKTRIVDYTVEEATGKLVSGSKTAEKFMTYEWDLTRTSGLTTNADGDVTRINCPSCGAPLDINASARCEYCDSVVNMNTHGWTIRTMRGISQRTA